MLRVTVFKPQDCPRSTTPRTHGQSQSWEQVNDSGRDKSYPFFLNPPFLAALVALPPPSGCDKPSADNSPHLPRSKRYMYKSKGFSFQHQRWTRHVMRVKQIYKKKKEAQTSETRNRQTPVWVKGLYRYEQRKSVAVTVSSVQLSCTLCVWCEYGQNGNSHPTFAWPLARQSLEWDAHPGCHSCLACVAR